MAFCPTLFSVTPVVTSLLVHHLFILSESAQAAITKQSWAGAEKTEIYVLTVVESGSPRSLGSEACAWQGLAPGRWAAACLLAVPHTEGEGTSSGGSYRGTDLSMGAPPS